jgi:ribosomal protein S18 acetylase RimI-like enzyme
VTIERVHDVTDELVDAFARLIPQLSTTASLPTHEGLAALVAHDDHYLLVARGDDGRIVGSLTLVLYWIPTRRQGMIHDVVVDDAARGQGVGEALSREALRIATEAGADSVRLTSRSHRVAAHRLYERLGFEPVDTNAYVWRPH